MRIVEIVYLDGLVEHFEVPAHIQLVKRPDLLELGTIHIERPHVRRWSESTIEEES